MAWIFVLAKLLWHSDIHKLLFPLFLTEYSVMV